MDSRYILEVDLIRSIDGLLFKSERENDDMPHGFLI